MQMITKIIQTKTYGNVRVEHQEHYEGDVYLYWLKDGSRYKATVPGELFIKLNAGAIGRELITKITNEIVFRLLEKFG